MSIGLVLEGGGMRGMFTTGVLDFFLEKNIEFDNILSVSAGACHAVSYLSKQPKRSFVVSTDYLDDKRYCGIYSFITTGDFFGADMIYNKIPNELVPFDYEAFNNSKTKMQVVMSDCATGRAEYPYLGDLRKDIIKVRASSTLPLLSKPVKIGERYYFDGGICDSIPLLQSEKEGFVKNVVVLTQVRDYVKKPTSSIPLAKIMLRKYPLMVEAMKNRHIMYNKELKYIKERERRGFAFVIAPKETLPVGRIEKDKNKLEECYNIGYETAKSEYENLLKFMR